MKFVPKSKMWQRGAVSRWESDSKLQTISVVGWVSEASPISSHLPGLLGDAWLTQTHRLIRTGEVSRTHAIVARAVHQELRMAVEPGRPRAGGKLAMTALAASAVFGASRNGDRCPAYDPTPISAAPISAGATNCIASGSRRGPSAMRVRVRNVTNSSAAVG